MDEAALLEGLDGAQREAVLTDASPLVILAPAGSGKTRVVSHRIARRVLDGSADAQHVLAITFTRRAAGELQRRLGRLGLRGRPTAGTFHGVAWAVLTQRWSDQRRARPELLADRVRLLEAVVGQLVPHAAGSPRCAWMRWPAELDWARARLVSAERYAEEARRGGRKPPLPPDLLAEVFSAYADQKRKRAGGRLRRPPRAVRRRARATSPTSPPRSGGASATSSSTSSRTSTRCSSASSRPGGATARPLRGGRPEPGDLRLERRRPDRSCCDCPRWWVARRSCVSTAATDRRPRCSPPPRPCSPDGEAPAAVRRRRTRARGARLRHRARRGPRHRRAAGRAPAGPAVVVVRGAGPHPGPGGPHRAAPCAMPSIPVRLRHDRPLLDLPGVQAALRQGDSAEPLGNVLEELEHRLATGAAEAAPGEAEPAGLRQLCSLGRELLSASPSATLGTFRAWLAAGGADVADGADAVDVLTFHAAKGLEWPLVVVAGVEAGLVPHHSATGVEGRAEETRLLYVALTRAEHELHCTWARSRGRDARRERKPSPLLELGPRRGDATAGRAAAVGSPAGRAARRPTGADGPATVARPLGPGGRRPRARRVLRRPALGPRRRSVRPRSTSWPASSGRWPPGGWPPGCSPCWPGERVGLSPSGRGRACIRLTKTSGSTDTNRASASAVSGVAVVERGRGVELAAVDPVDPAVEPELAVQRRGLAVADREQTGHPDQAGERHGEAEHLVEGGGDEPAVDAARRALVGVAEHHVTHDVLVGDAEHDAVAPAGWPGRPAG